MIYFQCIFGVFYLVPRKRAVLETVVRGFFLASGEIAR
jgi:hypothetical protein